ncbi:MAG: hypothetical protein JO348_13085 [Alphaproteobacteria bacterium]|nr:hypothetical protein [Alphaproteobacteria bacterium]MBV9903892.1 hypothetical protein [Alphaproteobacteria bacterium]
MTEKTGEIVRTSGNYRCKHCHQTTHFNADQLFTKCPHCGYETFDLTAPRFENKDGTLGPHEPS